MTVRASLRRATGELYRTSWRLLVLNSAVSLTILAVVLVVNRLPLALLLAPLVAGPVVAALVHCTVKLIEEEDFVLADGVEGLRLHWRRGLELGALMGAGLLGGTVAVSFYATPAHRAWPLAALAAYLLALFLLGLLIAWPLAIAQPSRPLRDVLRETWLMLLRTPLRVLGLGGALLLVNAAGAVTVLPLLTLTIAYSFLAVGHVVLPRSSIEEEVTA